MSKEKLLGELEESKVIETQDNVAPQQSVESQEEMDTREILWHYGQQQLFL